MENQELINKFLDYCKAKGIGSLRLIKYEQSLAKISNWINKPFNDATKDDIINLMVKLEDMPYKAWTKNTYRVIVKRFFKWLKGNDEIYPPEVAWIKTSIAKNNQKLPEQLLTENDIENMINNASNVRDKTFIHYLFHSAGRIAEVLNLKVKDVNIEEYDDAVVVYLNGKTGSRRVIVPDINGYMKNWLKANPYRYEPEGYIFVSLANNGQNTPMVYQSAVKLVKGLGSRAGIRKPLNFHHFRHSKCTLMAQKLTESQLKQFAGWTMGSTMANTYVHLAGRDLDQPILEMSGLLNKELEKEEKIFKTFEKKLASDENFRKQIANVMKKSGIKI